ncbi:hypothetical protein HK099_006956 [Clydaea vesicula]|uniref:dihydroorotase n=1 Tax=Clydaea vesicula TaxID=447962 RepID=A0AAD5U1V6_9FUNG|nr:hypothetical protein HK099_006956 [Clydaea vesicula]
MKLVTPLLEKSGVRNALVMPNLKPPITTTSQALSYKKELQVLAPNVNFLMTLYLVPELTPKEIYLAKKSGVVGVKSYPRGVTTNSDSGIESYTAYYHIFKAMEEVGMILNLHGEIPSDADNGVCVLNAEEKFLTHLKQLNKDFPNLKIVLEHATTKAAVEMVKSLNDNVGCTITIHHLELTVDDWAGCCHCYCKPVAKFPYDRKALQDVVREGHKKFFLGTDSAPHARHLKEGPNSAAGVFTGPYVTEYLAHALDSFNAIDKLEGFACINGRNFYGLDVKKDLINGQNRGISRLENSNFKILDELPFKDDEGIERTVVPYKAGKILNWKLKK